MKLAVVLVALSLCLVSIEAACDCPAATDAEKFCDSDFVLKVVVKDEAAVGDNNQYTVEIKTEYRAGDEIDAAKKVVQSASGECGVKLTPGSTYFLMGNFQQDADGNSVLGTTACDMAVDPKDPAVTEIMKADISCGKRSAEMELKSLLRRVLEENEPVMRTL